MKKTLSVILGCLIVLCFTPAAYSGNVYIGGNIGLAMQSDSEMKIDGFDEMIGMPADVELEFETGFVVAGSVGYDFGPARVEGEVSYQKNNFDKLTVSASGMSASIDLSGDATSLAFLANGYYDFVNNSAFTPYVSGGIGIANISYNDISSPSMDINSEGDEDDTVFAYQVGAGIGFAATETLTIDLKYRYYGTADPEFEGVKAEVGSHNILLGLRYNF